MNATTGLRPGATLQCASCLPEGLAGPESQCAHAPGRSIEAGYDDMAAKQFNLMTE